MVQVMARRKGKQQVIRLVRELVRAGRYEFTRHAKQEMREDGLAVPDIRRILLEGSLVRVQTGNVRGPRYILQGRTEDRWTVEAVCRFVQEEEGEIVLVITVYVVE